MWTYNHTNQIRMECLNGRFIYYSKFKNIKKQFMF